jgi:hypothetical protein
MHMCTYDSMIMISMRCDEHRTKVERYLGRASVRPVGGYKASRHQKQDWGIESHGTYQSKQV